MKLTDDERRVAFFALGVLAVCGLVTVYLGETHDFGRSFLSSPTYAVWFWGQVFGLMALGVIWGIAIVGELRGEAV